MSYIIFYGKALRLIAPIQTIWHYIRIISFSIQTLVKNCTIAPDKNDQIPGKHFHLIEKRVHSQLKM